MGTREDEYDYLFKGKQTPNIFTYLASIFFVLSLSADVLQLKILSRL